ncbi:CIS tube protein [Photorhabdus viridis]|uniref:CIS tube protein n=1 Tax=Photorhabdus viridis TaxID=3163327 RepID=UPI0033077AEB
MGLLDIGLAKLTITAFSDREMKRKKGEIRAMYNPDSIQLNYHTDFTEDLFINRDKEVSKYQKVRPGGLSLELLFDARLPGNTASLDNQLANLRSLCCEVDNANNEPQFLQVRWGKMNWNGNGYFAGRMANLVVNYTLFDRDATPLRAKATLSLTADESLEVQQTSFNPNIADMNIVSVPDVSSLALIAASQEVDYLTLAVTNDLNNLDDIQPGKTLIVNQGSAS